MANRITGMFSRGPRHVIKEVVGKVVTARPRLDSKKSVDESVPDFAFWDAFRHGEKDGFELSSLLAKPATEIMASWVGTPDKLQVSDVGQGDVEHTNELLKRFIRRVRGTLNRLFVDLYGLGVQYVVVNPDGSLSVPSPHTVTPVYDETDYRRLVEVKIESKLSKATVTDEYRLDGRTITIKNTSSATIETVYGAISGGQTLRADFENLIGRLPVVHFVNDRGTNETQGRPIYAALYKWFSWYNDLLVKALKGAKMLSNPLLALFGLTDIDQTEANNSRSIGETYQDEDGTIQNRDRFVIDEEEPVVLLGEGADAKYVSPGTGFTNDIRNMLKALYLLFMEHLHLPDVVMGFEMAAARASAAEQIKTFFAHIINRRVALEGEGTDDLLMVEARGGLLAVVDIWLRIKQLTDPQVVVGPVAMTWPELNEADEQMRFNWIKYLDSKGYIQPQTTVEQSGTIEDAEAEYNAAQDDNQTQEGDQAARWGQEEAA